MRMSLYVVRDTVLEQSWNIAEAKNDGVAVRNFQKLVHDQDFEEDFVLLHVGYFDHDKDEGSFIPPRQVEVTLETEVPDED